MMIVSAFEPFGDDQLNSSLLVLNELPDELQGERIEKVVLPVRASAADMLAHCIVAHGARMIVMLGQAGGRNRIMVERIAINCDDYGIADCDGNIVRETKIIEGGADGLFTTLPYAAIIKDVQELGVDIAMSNTAGTYICNHVFYVVRHMFPSLTAGFIHIPYLECQGKAPFVTKKDAVDAIAQALSTTMKKAG